MQLIEQLREHFHKRTVAADPTDKVSTTKLSDKGLKYLESIISQAELTSIFNENAKCAAEQIPTALTAIIREYCCSDPFDFDDMDTIMAKVVQLTTRES